MAILSKGITLRYKKDASSSYTSLTNLLEIPEMGNTTRSREQIDITTLADDEKKNMDGLLEAHENQELTFKFLYEKSQFMELFSSEGKSCSWEILLPDGFGAGFTGIPTVKVDGAGVSTAVSYTLTVAVSSAITFTDFGTTNG